MLGTVNCGDPSGTYVQPSGPPGSREPGTSVAALMWIRPWPRTLYVTL